MEREWQTLAYDCRDLSFSLFVIPIHRVGWRECVSNSVRKAIMQMHVYLPSGLPLKDNETLKWNIKMAHIAAHLNADISLVVTV